MGTLAELLTEQEHFDTMNFDVKHFDRYNLTLNQLKQNQPLTYAAMQPLLASVAALQKQVNASKAGIMGSHGMDKSAIEQIVMESDAAFYISISRATRNILATNTVGPYTAGLPVSLPFVLFAFNDQNSNYSSSLKNALSVLNAACPGITYAVTQLNGTQIWTWTYVAPGPVTQTDVVKIFYPGTLTNYLNLVQNQSQDSTTFYSRYINYTISDYVNGSAQIYSGDVQWIDISNGGSQENAEILLNSLKFSWEFLQDRINLLYPQQHYNANLAVVDSIIACPASDVTANVPFVVTYNMFITKHNKYGTSKTQNRK